MLKFAVYDKDGPASSWPLVNAHLMGPEDTPVRGEVGFERGMIVCKKRGSQATALSLQYDAGPMGVLMLQTCLLPDREKPYALTVELARHRIKGFIAKSEEWQMFDLAADHAAVVLWEEARRLLTQSLVLEDPVRAERSARSALVRGIDASERLAMAHAEILLHRRYGQKAASSSTLGVKVTPGKDSPALREVIGKEFDVVSVPVRWKDLEVEEGKYEWGGVDAWMKWAVEQKKPIVAGPLLDFSKRAVPKWMYVWQNDYDTTRDLTYAYLEQVVNRYRGAVSMWNVGSGVNVNENFTFTQEQMVDLTRMASLLARQSRKGARTMMELSHPFSEHVATNRDAVGTMMFVERLIQEGVKLDAIGLQLVMGTHTQGRTARDLFMLSCLLDRFVLMQTPVVVSAAGVPSEVVDVKGGTWHEAWTEEMQAQWASRMFAMAMSKPFVESFCWSDAVDSGHGELAKGGLIEEGGRVKAVFGKLTGMRRRLRKPLGAMKTPFKTTSAGVGEA